MKEGQKERKQNELGGKEKKKQKKMRILYAGIGTLELIDQAQSFVCFYTAPAKNVFQIDKWLKKKL